VTRRPFGEDLRPSERRAGYAASPPRDHAALLAVLDGEMVGYGTHERVGAGSQSAEVAFSMRNKIT